MGKTIIPHIDIVPEDIGSVVHGFFVPASQVSKTNWSLIRARLDNVVRENYVSKTRNFPRGKILARYIHETVERHPGITTKELIDKLELPKSTVYDHVKYLIEEERTIKKINKKLYIIGQPPKIPTNYKYHNITVLFLVQHQVGVLNELCQHLKKSDLFNGHERTVAVWPPQREWRPIKKSCAINIACTDDPLTYEDMIELRALIWEFFGEKKRLRFNLERNIDSDTSKTIKINIQSTTITEEGRFIRQYLKKMKDKKVLRREKSVEGQLEIIQEFTEELEKDRLREKTFSLKRVIEELRKKSYRDFTEKKKLRKENQQLRGELLELKEQLKGTRSQRWEKG